MLEGRLDTEPDGRVALEAAASAGALGLARGAKRLSAVLWGESLELSVKAILILTEMKAPFARGELTRAAARFVGDERREAAIWGLGKAGLSPQQRDSLRRTRFPFSSISVTSMRPNGPPTICHTAVVLLMAGRSPRS